MLTFPLLKNPPAQSSSAFFNNQIYVIQDDFVVIIKVHISEFDAILKHLIGTGFSISVMDSFS
jgi:hypothetical protein